MKLLIINKNPVVSRMINLSAPKVGFEVTECDNIYNLPEGKFDVVILDDEMYDENFLIEIKDKIRYSQIGIITSSKNEIEGFDFILIKPFLPTDLIELLRGIKSKIEFIKKEEREESSDILTLNEDKKEEIVEFEEEEEETPLINEEEIEKSGVLDEKELEKVQELLEEKIVEEEKVAKEENDEIEKIKEDENKNLEEVEEETKEEIEEELEEKPAILEKVEEYKEKKSKKPKNEKYSSKEKIEALMGVLDLYTIRELLDGMEITIKINFNKKKKKK